MKPSLSKFARARATEARAIRRRIKADSLWRLCRPPRRAKKGELVDALSLFPSHAGLVRHDGSADDVFIELYAATWSRAWERPIEDFFETFGRSMFAESIEPELI